MLRGLRRERRRPHRRKCFVPHVWGRVRLVTTVALAATLALPAAQAAPEKHSARYVTAVKLNRGLAGSPMAGTGWALERAGWRHRVSPYFIAAIAATESSLGREACYGNRKNAFGLSSCGSGWYVPHFRSWEHAYMFTARFLATTWPGHTTPWSFRGYAACSDCWARKVASFMRSLFNVGYRTRYP